MIKEAIEKILDLGKPLELDIHNLKYSPHNLNLISPPEPDVLSISTLQGVIDYISINDRIPEKFFIHISGYDQINLYSLLSKDYRKREHYIKSDYISETFEFGYWHNTEKFIIELQSKFVHTKQLIEVIKIVSNVKSVKSLEVTDDGVSQNATAKTGIHMLENVTLPNPVTLKPFRTFNEIEQPDSSFILRGKEADNGISWALFGADDKQWQMKAIKSIKEWISSNLKTRVPIIA